MYCQPSPWLMVPSVMPWKRCAPSCTARKNACDFMIHDFRGERRTRVHDFEIEAIDLLPHFGAALFAHVAQIFARGGDAGDDR